MTPLDATSPINKTAIQASRGKPTDFPYKPLDLRCRPLVNMDFVASRQLVLPSRLLIQFLSVGSHVGSTLPSDPASQQRPCASLTFTSTRLVQGLAPCQSAGMPGTRNDLPAKPGDRYSDFGGQGQGPAISPPVGQRTGGRLRVAIATQGISRDVRRYGSIVQDRFRLHDSRRAAPCCA